MRKLAAASSKSLSPFQVEKLKYNAKGILIEVRKTLLSRFPFIGTIALSLELTPTRDANVTTMATDGKSVYCDIDFLSRLSDDEKLFILAHEVYHAVMLHSLRLGNRDRDLFNIATDIEVNSILAADGLQTPTHAVTAAKYGFPNGKCAEEYYEMLVQQDNACKPEQSCSSNQTGKLSGQFDKHIYDGDPMPDADSSSEKGCQADRYGKVGHDPDFKPEVTKRACEHIREIAAATAIAMQLRGNLPGHLQQLMRELLEPKVDWKEVLAQFMTKSRGESARTWNTCNRRFISQGTYLPSSCGEGIRVGVVLDVSGSVISKADEFLSEVNSIASVFSDYSICLVQCDTEVKSAKMYNSDEPLDLTNLEYEICGGGGTRLMPGFKWLEDNCIDVDCIVVFTDCKCEQMKAEDAPEVPVLWISTEKGEHKNIGFGEVVHYSI